MLRVVADAYPKRENADATPIELGTPVSIDA